jgi:serine protease Do
MKAATKQMTQISPAIHALYLLIVTGFVWVLLANAALSRGAPDSFADLAEQISPSVVNITTTTTVVQSQNRPIVPEGSPLEDFFRDFQDRRGERQRQGSALGSGFVISDDGYIVTNNHVIEQADEIIIEFFDGKELKAEIVGTDPKTDIAVLKVDHSAPLEFVTFGDSDTARVGDWVMAMGNPLGQGFSVSVGIISARNRLLRGSYDDFLQTDAAINRGNSGGPLFNLDGEVIGVNTAILSPNGGSIGIGFSMSSRVVKTVVRQLREYGETKRGWLGVRIQDVEEDVAEALGLEKAAGALVTDVPDGPAKDAGILAGDVILTFDGTDVVDTRGLVRTVGAAEVGKTVRVVVFREGGTQTLMVEVGRLESVSLASTTTSDDATPMPEPQEMAKLGLMVGPITDEARSEFGLEADETGVLILEIDEDSEAFEKGLRVGDVIAEIAQTAVTTPAQMEERMQDAIEAGRKSVLMLVRREGQPRFVAIEPNPSE